MEWVLMAKKMLCKVWGTEKKKEKKKGSTVSSYIIDLLI